MGNGCDSARRWCWNDAISKCSVVKVCVNGCHEGRFFGVVIGLEDGEDMSWCVGVA
jgi:hypothetical protein